MEIAKIHHPASRLATAITRTMRGDAGGGLLLIGVALAAMLAANSPLHAAYHALFHHPLGWPPIARLPTLHAWINDGLMAVFFFVVGLEIKREVVQGALADRARRRLPVIAAAAGMATPAIVYLAIVHLLDARAGGALQRGWAIPAATDIAFALGVLGLLGPRVPPALRLFLLTVAIVDDLGAVAIIAVFYSGALDPAWSLAALAVLATMVALNRAGVLRAVAYVPLALALWLCVLHSGIHATVAGVAAALTIPLRLDARGDSLLLRLEHALVPWNAYVIVPLFGFANAGVALFADGAHAAQGNAATLPLAIACGLFVGKQAGVLGAIALAERLRLAPRPAGAGWPQVWGISLLCGIGFTMSLFIGGLAFAAHPDLAERAKLGVLGGSLLSALAGYAVLRLAPRAPRD